MDNLEKKTTDYLFLDFEKYRYYHCKKESNFNYSCKRVKQPVSLLIGSEILPIPNKIPEIKLFDSLMLKYKLIPNVNILEKNT